jgi:4-hydroxybenzoate polyprenyltransferase
MTALPQAPADALPMSWVNHAPGSVQPYLRLMRLDRPHPAWLLFWPCVFGLAMGAIATHRGFLVIAADWKLVALFAIGSLVMRGAGCTYNDIVDRDIDAKVERTRGRPIPSGAVSATAAALFLIVQLLIGLAILLSLNRFSIILGASSLILIAIYPFMKRITWWPQAWLGLTFNWGALLGFSAITGHLTAPAYVLYIGCFFWTLGYDTIYAQQDTEDDALFGVKSTARLFGDMSPVFILGFYVICFVLIAIAAFAATRNPLSVVFLMPATVHLLWQAAALKIRDSAICLRIFRSNRDVGFLIAVALIAASHL